MDSICSSESRLTFKGRHGVISQKIENISTISSSAQIMFLFLSLLSLSFHSLFLLQISFLMVHSYIYVYLLLLFFPRSAGALSAIYQFSLTVRPIVLEPVTHGNHLLLIENQPDDESIKGVKPHPLTIFISSHLSSPSLANTHVHVPPLSEQAQCLPKALLSYKRRAKVFLSLLVNGPLLYQHVEIKWWVSYV